MTLSKKFPLFLLLSSGFINYLGVGLIFPIFAFLFFDTKNSILPVDTSEAVRGLIMGVLISVGSLVLFFSSPLLGTLSDHKGRRKILLYSLSIAIVGYLVAVAGVQVHSVALLFLSRVLYGLSAGSMTVVQASIVDLSTMQEKAKNFGLFTMVQGAGFSFGPFIGGALTSSEAGSYLGYGTPFVFAAILTLINWMLIFWKFEETHVPNKRAKISLTVGISHLKKAFGLKEIRLLFTVMLLYFFGWDFFVEFVSVFLLKQFHFTPTNIGGFYAYTGILFALCAGILIRPVIKRFPPKKVLEAAMLLAGSYFFLFLLIQNAHIMWFYLIPLVYFIALVYPTATTVVSNAATADTQGEMLGIYGSVQSLALIVSPFFAGSLVGDYPFMCIIVAGSMMLISGTLLFLFRSEKKKSRK